MAPKLRPAAAREKVGEFLHFGRLGVARQLSGELGARVDADLAVDARELGADRLRRHEQGGCDLLVGAALGGERGDAAFGRRQLAGGRGAPADARELGASLRRPRGARRAARRSPAPARAPRAPGASSGRAGASRRARAACGPRSKGIETRSCWASAFCSDASAPSRSPRAAARSPRQRPPPPARRHGRGRAAWRSRTPSSASASSMRPSAISASISSGTKRTEPGSRTPPASSRAPIGPSSRCTASNRSSESSSRPSAQAPRMVAIITPCSGASASVVSASARAPSTSPRAARTSPRTPSAVEALRLLVGLERDLDSLLRACRSASSQRPARNSAQQSWARIHGSALSSARSSDRSRRERKSSHATRELVDPGQDDAEGEGRADGGLNGPRPLLELPAALERRPPFAPARHRVDEAEHG